MLVCRDVCPPDPSVCPAPAPRWPLRRSGQCACFLNTFTFGQVMSANGGENTLEGQPGVCPWLLAAQIPQDHRQSPFSGSAFLVGGGGGGIGACWLFQGNPAPFQVPTAPGSRRMERKLCVHREERASAPSPRTSLRSSHGVGSFPRGGSRIFCVRLFLGDLFLWLKWDYFLSLCVEAISGPWGK